MITTALVLAASLGLFVFWFRYTCVLILSAKTSRDYAGEVAAVNGLTFVTAERALLQVSKARDLDDLCMAMQRDYAVVCGLLKHAGFETGGVEDAMLRIDFRMMNTLYSVSRHLSPRHAANAVLEMSQIIGHFADSMGERATCASGA
jgi:hypothetical protein